MNDFTVFAPARLTKNGDAKWNPRCRISEPNDNVIDDAKLAVFAASHAAGIRQHLIKSPDCVQAFVRAKCRHNRMAVIDYLSPILSRSGLRLYSVNKSENTDESAVPVPAASS